MIKKIPIQTLFFQLFILLIKSFTASGAEISIPVKENFSFIGHCDCVNVSTKDRQQLVRKVEEFLKETPEHSEFVLVSYGSGRLELELNILVKALENDYKKVQIFLVDFYEEGDLLSALNEFRAYIKELRAKFVGAEIQVHHADDSRSLDFSSCDLLNTAKIVSLAVDPQRFPTSQELAGYRLSASSLLGREDTYVKGSSSPADEFDLGVKVDPGESHLMFRQFFQYYYQLVARINQEQGTETEGFRRHFILHQRSLVQVSSTLESNQIELMDLADFYALSALQKQDNRLFFTGSAGRSRHPVLVWLGKNGIDINPFYPLNRNWISTYFTDIQDLRGEHCKIQNNCQPVFSELGKTKTQALITPFDHFLRRLKNEYPLETLSGEELGRHAFAVLFVSYVWEFGLQNHAYHLTRNLYENLSTELKEADKNTASSDLVDKLVPHDSLAMVLHNAAWSVGVRNKAFKAAQNDPMNCTRESWQALQTQLECRIMLDNTRNMLRKMLSFDTHDIIQIQADVLSKLQQKNYEDQNIRKYFHIAVKESVYTAATESASVKEGILQQMHEKALQMMIRKDLPTNHEFSSLEQFQLFYNIYFEPTKGIGLASVEGLLQYLKDIAKELDHRKGL